MSDNTGYCKQCENLADEIEELRAKVAELDKQLEERKSTNVGWRHYEAEQAMSRKLYEALKATWPKGSVDAINNIIAEYERTRHE